MALFFKLHNVSVQLHMSWPMCGVQRTTLWSQLLPLYGVRDELRSPGLHSKHPPSAEPSGWPSIYFLICLFWFAYLFIYLFIKTCSSGPSCQEFCMCQYWIFLIFLSLPLRAVLQVYTAMPCTRQNFKNTCYYFVYVHLSVCLCLCVHVCMWSEYSVQGLSLTLLLSTSALAGSLLASSVSASHRTPSHGRSAGITGLNHHICFQRQNQVVSKCLPSRCFYLLNQKSF